MSDTLIKVEGVSKKFCRSLKRSLWYGVQDLGDELLGRRHGGNGQLRPDEFWAVNDVSFELKRGECLGLIGQNGAGKTTLLRMLNGLIKPDQGRIEMHGRVGALIALGAGFNPILTGRENIYVNGSVLGLSKREIDEKIDEIIDFAEIGEFIDSPVQSYSSGMIVRLGFAVATAMEPDVLLLDEVLAVGDAAFRAKCYSRISKLVNRAALIFVSHSMEQIGQVCTRVVVMQPGQSPFVGDVADGINRYNQLNKSAYSDAERHEHMTDGVRVSWVEFPDRISYGSDLLLRIECKLPRSINQADVKVTVFDSTSQIAAEAYTKITPEILVLNEGTQTLNIAVGPFFLLQGLYSLSLVLLDRSNNEHLYWGSRIRSFYAEGPMFGSAKTLPPIHVTAQTAV